MPKPPSDHGSAPLPDRRSFTDLVRLRPPASAALLNHCNPTAERECPANTRTSSTERQHTELADLLSGTVSDMTLGDDSETLSKSRMAATRRGTAATNRRGVSITGRPRALVVDAASWPTHVELKPGPV